MTPLFSVVIPTSWQPAQVLRCLARGSVVASADDDSLPQRNWLLTVLSSFSRGAQVITGQMP